MIAVPIVGSGQPFGAIVFALCRGSDKSRFNKADVALAQELGRRIGMALEKARLYNKLVEREKELRNSNERKDEFLAMLSHELRNPLAPIRNAVHVLELGANEAKRKWAHEVIKRQTDHMVRLVDDLLDISRITQGKITLKREAVELASIVADAVESVRPAIDGKRQQLSVQLPDSPIWLEADRARLVQIVSNLLNNAVKFTAVEGMIAVRASRIDDMAVISVRDSGVGIPAEELEYIFDLFAQAHSTLARSGGGLGIGLALVKKLVEMHGGTVSAASDGPGHGSEFVVSLPITMAKTELDQVDGAAPTTSGVLAGQRILVVDDNVDSAESLATILQLHGAAVKVAHDGLSAVVTARSFAPHIVMADIGLPDIDGYEMARRLRATSEAPLLIAISGYGDAQARERSMQAGFAHHLIKPVNLDAAITLLTNASGTSANAHLES